MSVTIAEPPLAAHRGTFADPATDFSDGLKVIDAYHRGFLAYGQRLLLLADGLCEHGVDAARSREAAALACYYDQATRLHHRDEERALFPLIVNRSFLIDGMIERLALDHEELENLWVALAGGLGGLGTITDRGEWRERVRRFERQLRTHIEREDMDFFPEVANLLPMERRSTLGRRMAALRRA
ncbi:MAG: hemerythrin domain-containing protein [Gammaproteobacteria bacterium]